MPSKRWCRPKTTAREYRHQLGTHEVDRVTEEEEEEEEEDEDVEEEEGGKEENAGMKLMVGSAFTQPLTSSTKIELLPRDALAVRLQRAARRSDSKVRAGSAVGLPHQRERERERERKRLDSTHTR